MNQEELKNLVQYTTELAMLDIPEQERETFYEQIGKILNFVEKLNELNTENIDPVSHILPVHNVTRKDIPVPSLERQAFLNLSPDHNEEFIKVPVVIQES